MVNNSTFETKTPGTSPPILSIDWLQIYCTGKVLDLPPFTFKKEEYQTRHFKKVYSIFKKSNQIGTLTAEPHAKILNPLALIIKFENSLLYSLQMQSTIFELLQVCNFQYKSITRADVCIDFHNFEHNLEPGNFLRGFFSDVYLKNGRSKFASNGIHDLTNNYTYIRFGTRESSHIIYLYNKSLELKEVHEKPWIREFWKKNGLSEPPDIWRLEFSFKGSQNKILDQLTGEIDKINLNTIFSFPHLHNLMNTAINQLFSFKINDYKKNKTRMPDLELFKNIIPGKRLLKIPDTESPKRTEKLLLKKLVELATNAQTTNDTQFYFYNQTIFQLTNLHGLHGYLRKVLQYTINPQIIYV